MSPNGRGIFSPLLFLALGALSIVATVSQGEELPAESQDLVRQLKDWEFTERTTLERRLHAKRAEVIESLEYQQETVTKQGDLDAALAIKKQIAALVAEDRRPPVGMTFQFPWGKDRQVVQVEFFPEGIATWNNLTVDVVFERQFRWALRGDQQLELWTQARKAGEGVYWIFSEDFTKAQLRHQRGDRERYEAKRVK